MDNENDVNENDVNENENLDRQEGNETIVDKTTVDETIVDKTTVDETIVEKTTVDEIEKPGAEDTSKVEGKKEEIDPVQKRINKVIYDKKVAEEKLQAEQARREEVEKKLAEATKEVLPDIPPVPDYMDPEYAKKLEEREAIIVKHAQDAVKKEALLQIQHDKAIDAQKKDAEKVKTMISDFEKRTEELKLDKDTLTESQNTVGAFLTGKTELARFLLSDKNGPLNVLYLSQNASELEKISKMPETEAAVYIATTIASEAEKLKPKTTSAPDPHYSPKGKGKIEDEDPNLEGCTFT